MCLEKKTPKCLPLVRKGSIVEHKKSIPGYFLSHPYVESLVTKQIIFYKNTKSRKKGQLIKPNPLI